jgi:hypothetical protein
MTADYLALVKRSGAIRADEERAAERAADRTFDGSNAGPAADQLQARYDIAAARHFDRRAALAKHFGQHWAGPGDPYATHALRWLAENVSTEPVASVSAPATRLVKFNGIEHTVGAVTSPSGAPSPLPKFNDPPRGTFTGSPAEFEAAKRAAVEAPWPTWMKQEGNDG